MSAPIWPEVTRCCGADHDPHAVPHAPGVDAEEPAIRREQPVPGQALQRPAKHYSSGAAMTGRGGFAGW